MNEFDDILLLEPNDLDIDNIINDLNPITLNYEQLKQDLNAIRDKSTIQFIDRSYCSLDKLEGNTFDGFFQLIDLNLSHNILISLPKGVFDQLLILQIVNLSHNLITQLEDSLFENNKQLRIINLSNNLLNEFNGCAFDNLSLLRKLDFSYNRIESLTKKNVESISLQDFNLSNNIIFEIKAVAFWFVPNLIHLQLNNNRISHLTNNLFENTTQIQYLNLSNNNIKKLNKKIFAKMHNLKQVDFSNNSITALNKCLENNPNLNELNLLNNPIKKFSKQEFIVCENINTFKLTIHESYRLEGLRILNQISDFELHIKSDKIFPLNRFFLCWIKAKHLQRLCLVVQKGELHFCYEILNLENLEFLHIKFLEPINILNEFNIGFYVNRMPKLKHLALININKMKIIINENHTNQTNLTYLDLTGIENKSVDFLRNNFIILEHLNLSFSKVESISRDLMSTLPNLKFLNMNGTRISVIEDNLFQYNSNLEVIFLQDCQIHTIGENCFQNLENLNQIDIRGNTQLKITQSLLNGIPKSAVVFYD